MLNSIYTITIGSKKAINAIMSVPTSTYHITDNFVRYMGFSDSEDYMQSYPGKFSEGDVISKWKGIKRDVDINAFYRIYHKHYIKSKDMLLFRGKRQSSANSLIITPTIEQITKSHGFSKLTTTNSIDLWFCSDWKDCVEDR